MFSPDGFSPPPMEDMSPTQGFPPPMDDFSGLGDSEEDDEDEDDLEGTDESFDLTGLSDKLNSLEIHRISNLPPREILELQKESSELNQRFSNNLHLLRKEEGREGSFDAPPPPTPPDSPDKDILEEQDTLAYPEVLEVFSPKENKVALELPPDKIEDVKSEEGEEKEVNASELKTYHNEKDAKPAAPELVGNIVNKQAVIEEEEREKEIDGLVLASCDSPIMRDGAEQRDSVTGNRDASCEKEEQDLEHEQTKEKEKQEKDREHAKETEEEKDQEHAKDTEEEQEEHEEHKEQQEKEQQELEKEQDEKAEDDDWGAFPASDDWGDAAAAVESSEAWGAFTEEVRTEEKEEEFGVEVRTVELVEEEFGDFGKEVRTVEEEEDDEFGDFGEAEESPRLSQEAEVKPGLSDCLELLRSWDQLSVVLGLSEEEEEEEWEERKDGEGQLEGQMQGEEEVWKRLEDPACSPGLDYVWRGSDTYTLVLDTLGIDSRVLLDGTGWRGSVRQAQSLLTPGLLTPVPVAAMEKDPSELDYREASPLSPLGGRKGDELKLWTREEGPSPSKEARKVLAAFPLLDFMASTVLARPQEGGRLPRN